MTFIRLAGCNASAEGLACVRWCDTPESWDSAAGTDHSVGDVVGSVGLPRACVTGGEPLLQGRPLEALLGQLHERDIRVHLETNGSVPLPEATAFDWVTVSPKPPLYWIDPAFRGRIDELKLVVDADFHEDRAEHLGKEHPEAVVCLQPEASGGQAAVERTARFVLAHGDWRLSLQLHKIVGIE